MNISQRPYADTDLSRLHSAMASWTHDVGGCAYIHPGEIAHRIYEDLAGKPIADLVQVSEDGVDVVGLTINGRFDTTFDVYVKPSLRGSDVEVQMLQRAYDTTLSFAKPDTLVNTDVYACDYVRIDLLKQLGFEKHRVWDYINRRDLSSPIAGVELPGGFSIRNARWDDSEQLAIARNSAFGSSWTGQSLLDDVMSKPGYEPEHETVVVTDDGRIAAFTVCHLDELNKVGHFEPVGTHADFHRLGLAKAMMLHVLRDLKPKGYEYAAVAHAADNKPALKLYQSLGFEKQFETHGFQR